MATVLTCTNPACGKKLRLPDAPDPGSANAAVRCPACKNVIRLEKDAQATRTLDRASASPAAPERETLTLAGEVSTSNRVVADETATRTLGGGDGSTREETSKNLPQRIGRFEVRRLLGEGAFGKVYEAYDPQLDRAVALKVAKIDRGHADQRVKRFLREAKAAANLRHPHIVPLYEYGQDGDQFFIASAFIRGRTLQDDLTTRKTQAPDLTHAVRVVRQLAEALAYAHGQGIVHRDVKPANVMLDEKNESMLMDFGLAARQEEAEKLTHAGQVMGTPLYMAPEQAKGAEGAAQPAADQYSLGVMLFEMITGRPPFEGTPELVMFHHVETEPPRPSRWNRALDRNLETICLKCLDKIPARRYASCQALAEDLRRYAMDEPIVARRVGPAIRLAKWCRRNRLTTVAIVAVAASLGIGALVASGLLARVTHERELTKKQASIAKANEEKADWNSYARKIALAQAAYEGNDKAEALRNLEECDTRLRGWEHAHIANLASNEKQIMPVRLTGDYEASVFSPDGMRIAAGDGKCIKVLDAQTGQLLLELQGHTGRIRDVRYGGNGQRLLSRGEQQELIVWDSADGKILTKLSGFNALAASRDGEWIASGKLSGELHLWDGATGKQSFDLKGHESPIVALAASSDGSKLLSGDFFGEIRLWNIETGKASFAIKAHDCPVSSLAISGDGKWILSSCQGPGSQGKLWDARTGKECFAFYPSGLKSISRIAFLADGNRFASFTGVANMEVRSISTGNQLSELQGGWINDADGLFGSSSPDGTLAVISPDTALPAVALNGHKARVFLSQVIAGEKRIVTGSIDGTIRIWEQTTGQDLLVLKMDGLRSLSISRDGRRFVGTASSGALQIWDATNAKTNALRLLGASKCIAISGDGARVVTGRSDGSIAVWDANCGKELLAIAAHDRAITHISIDQYGKRIVSGSKGVAKVWDASSGRLLLTSEFAKSLAISDDGKRIGTFSDDSLFFIDAENGKLKRFDFPSRDMRLCQMEASNDFRRILAIGPDFKSVSVWKVDATDSKVRPLEGSAGLPSVNGNIGISGDGKLSVSSNFDGNAKAWSTETGRLVKELEDSSNHFSAIGLSRDGKIIAGSRGKVVKVWDISGRKQAQTLMELTGNVSALAINADGARVVALDENGVVKVGYVDLRN